MAVIDCPKEEKVLPSRSKPSLAASTAFAWSSVSVIVMSLKRSCNSVKPSEPFFNVLINLVPDRPNKSKAMRTRSAGSSMPCIPSATSLRSVVVGRKLPSALVTLMPNFSNSSLAEPMPCAVSPMLRLKRSRPLVSSSDDTPVCPAANCSDCSSLTVRPRRPLALASSSICPANCLSASVAPSPTTALRTLKTDDLTLPRPARTDANARCVLSKAVIFTLRFWSAIS